MIRSLFVVLALAVAVLPQVSIIASAAELKPKELLKRVPEALRDELKDTVDPWGMAFSDQLARYERAHLEAGRPPFVVGVESSLRKVFRPKYWFRGEFNPGEIRLSAARNEWEAFQVAVLPPIGGRVEAAKVELSAFQGPEKIAVESVRIYRVGFVETVRPAYPVMHVGQWPDPLFPNEAQDAEPPNTALWWVEVRVAKDAIPGEYSATLTVTAQQPAYSSKLPVRLRVFDFALPDRVPFPVSVWTQWNYPWDKKMTPEEAEQHVRCLLEHGLDPVNLGPALGDVADPQSVSERMQGLIARGLQITRLDEMTPELYARAEKDGWLPRVFHYLMDEASREMFEQKVIPQHRDLKQKYPGLRTMVSAQNWGDMKRGCDIWVTDPSTYTGIEKARQAARDVQFWLYFCHLPIRVEFFRPMVREPAVLIDTPAVEARLIFWLLHQLAVDGLMFWPGNHWDDDNSEDWRQSGWKLTRKPLSFPYAGIHNGNAYLIYPGPVPSLRMKVLRDGLEDYGYLTELDARLKNTKDEGLRARGREVLDSRTEILIDAHYFNRDPDAILKKRLEVASLLEALLNKAKTAQAPKIRPGDYRNKANWRRIKMGMTRAQVREILGDPPPPGYPSPHSLAGSRKWLYPDAIGGSVHFSPSGRVDGWRAP